MSSGLQGAWWRIMEHCCLTAKGKGPGFVSLWVSLWALAACPLLRVISAHTLGGVGERAFLWGVSMFSQCLLGYLPCILIKIMQ